MEQNQTKDKNETQQQDQQSPMTPQIEKQELETPPQEKLSKNSRENLLTQVVEDTEDQNWANIPEIIDKWPEKLWSMVEQAK